MVVKPPAASLVPTGADQDRALEVRAANTRHLRGPSAPGAPITQPDVEDARREYPSIFDVMVAARRCDVPLDSGFSGCAPESLDPEQELVRQLEELKSGLTDWGVGDFDFARMHAEATQWVARLREDELVPRHWHGQPIDFPDHLYLTFEPGPAGQLGFYAFGRSLGHGLKYTINLNPVAILRWKRSPAQTASVLLHEMHHLAEDLYFQREGRKRRGNGSYHLREFRLRVQALGIPCTKDGRELGIVPDGPFDKWLERHGIPRVHEYLEEMIEAPRRLPKRISWRCRCEDGVAVQVPRGSVLHARCEKCDHLFEPTTLAQSMRPGAKTRRIIGR